MIIYVGVTVKRDLKEGCVKQKSTTVGKNKYWNKSRTNNPSCRCDRQVDPVGMVGCKQVASNIEKNYGRNSPYLQTR